MIYDHFAAAKNISESSSYGFIVVAVALIIVFLFICLWKVYRKAGRPGWAALIPFYNTYVLFEIAGLSGLMGLIASLLVYFAGYANNRLLIAVVIVVYTVLYIYACVNLAKKFNKGPVFGVICLTILPFIGYPYLAFSDAKYNFPEKTKDSS